MFCSKKNEILINVHSHIYKRLSIQTTFHVTRYFKQLEDSVFSSKNSLIKELISFEIDPLNKTKPFIVNNIINYSTNSFLKN